MNLTSLRLCVDAAVELEEYEPGYLLGSIEILGVRHHLELMEVADCPQTGIQKPVGQENCNEERIDNLTLYAGGGRFETVEIDGRKFVLAITPYSE